MNLGHKRWKGLRDQLSLATATLVLAVFVLQSAGCLASLGPSRLGAVSPEVVTATSMASVVSPSPTETSEVAITVPLDLSPQPRIVRIAAPNHLLPLVNEAIRMAQLNHPQWMWETIVSEQPENLLEQGRAQLAIVDGDKGLFVGRTPLVLAIPFTSEWEGVSLQDAQRIMNEGHDLVSILDWLQKPCTLKALKIDGLRPTDRDYPLQREWHLIAAEGYEKAASDLAPYVSDRFQGEPCVHLAAVGDIMLDRALGKAIEAGKTTYPFELVVDLLAQADIAVGNFESALGEGGQAEDKSYTFRAPSGAVDALKLAGFDLLSLANNHAMDYGAESMLSTIAAFSEKGIATVGAGVDEAAAHAPVFFEVHGLKLAFLAYVDVPVEGRGFDARQWVATEESPGVAWA
jgi:hypothetical protein